MDGLIQIRWHGRGGQGAVTASELLAEAALHEGKYLQAFPDYGAERMGAPIRAYTRIGSSPIREHCQVGEPDVAVVLDATLIGVVNPIEGIRNPGVVVANTSLAPAELRERLGLSGGKVFTVDATHIAMETIGRNIPNTPILGALVRAVAVVSKDSIIDVIRDHFSARVSGVAAEANVAAFEQAYSEVREG